MLLKKYSDFGGEKKKFDSEFLSYNLMLNSVKKFALYSRVVRKGINWLMGSQYSYLDN
jgi:hypothetical protein